MENLKKIKKEWKNMELLTFKYFLAELDYYRGGDNQEIEAMKIDHWFEYLEYCEENNFKSEKG